MNRDQGPGKGVPATALPSNLSQQSNKMGQKRARGKSNQKKKDPSKLELLLKLIENCEGYYLHLDQYETPMIRLKIDQNTACSYQITSDKVENFICKKAYEVFKEAVSKQNMDSLLRLLKAKALAQEKKIEMEVRSGSHNGNIYYDLGNGAIKFAKGQDWILELNPPPLFQRFGMFRNQSKPALQRSSLDEFLALWEFKTAEEKYLLKVFIISCFVPGFPHPMLVLYGDPGSAKSTLMRFLVKLIDPAATDEIQIHKPEELIQAASHRLVLPLDNLRAIKPAISDLLCKIITGSGSSKRTLYTNDDDQIRKLRRIIIANGVNLPFGEPDLLDRSILLQLSRIPDYKRRTENDVQAEFDKILPGLLATCFDIVSKAMMLYDCAKNQPNLPRMADFAICGCAISIALGRSCDDFLSAYRANINTQNIESVEASPVASAITFYLHRHAQLGGSSTEILKILGEIWLDAGLNPKQKPSSARSFGKALAHIKTNLEALGYSISYKKSNGRHYLILPPNHDQNVQMSINSDIKGSFPDNAVSHNFENVREPSIVNSCQDQALGISDILDVKNDRNSDPNSSTTTLTQIKGTTKQRD